MGAAANVPSRCKRCKLKKHSKQLDTIFCEKHFEFRKRCKDFVLDRRRESFQNLCSNVMNHRTKNGGWSSFEIDFRKHVLDPEDLKEGRDFKHNFKVQNEEQTGYFEVDFFLFQLRGIIEVDGGAWHSEMGHGSEKDGRRDQWFNKLGYPVCRVKGPEDYEVARQFLASLRASFKSQPMILMKGVKCSQTFKLSE